MVDCQLGTALVWFGTFSESSVRRVTFHHSGRRQVGSVLADQVTPVIPKHGKPVPLHEAAAR